MRIQNDEFAVPLVPLTIHENGCLNFRSLIDIVADKTLLSPRHSPYLYPNGIDELSPKLGRLKRDSLHLIFEFGDNGYINPSTSITLNILLRMYRHCRFSSPKNHIPDEIEIHQLLDIEI